MNPLHWTREHQLAWAVISAIGVILGLMLGFIHSPDFSMSQTWQAFEVWSSQPKSIWAWPSFGLLFTGLALYAAQLFRSAN